MAPVRLGPGAAPPAAPAIFTPLFVRRSNLLGGDLCSESTGDVSFVSGTVALLEEKEYDHGPAKATHRHNSMNVCVCACMHVCLVR